MSLPECSAIYFFGSIVGDAALGSSRRASPLLFSSVPALSDPSPIDDMGFCGMNFFSIGRHYGNTRCRCQLITEENLVFRENRGPILKRWRSREWSDYFQTRAKAEAGPTRIRTWDQGI